MRADDRFGDQPMSFWANVRTISQEVGYTVRGRGLVRVPGVSDMAAALQSAGFSTAHLLAGRRPTPLANALSEYFLYRANVLNDYVEPRLMMAEEARRIFDDLRRELSPRCPLPRNKQRGEKAGPALFTGIINMLIEANVGTCPVDYDPRRLTTVTRRGEPSRTMARRIDGAMPRAVNPIAVWEIKEYYYTTTFGSRVADGVYESLLDGLELKELRENEGVEVDHVLMVDAHYTWWECGKSYLCRMIDMLNMGLVDELLFGREVLERLPALASSWAARHRADTQPHLAAR